VINDVKTNTTSYNQTQSCNEIRENIESSHQLNSIRYETTINELNSKIGELEVVDNLFCGNKLFYFYFLHSRK
jgi:hypothetical protein